MKQGAFDYLLKPLDTQQLRHVGGQALELSRLAREPRPGRLMQPLPEQTTSTLAMRE
jgi:DNA-binding NtrC family response regulator